MSDKPPANDGAATPSQASEGVIKVLAALTILALLVQGIVMLQSQVTYLSNLKPKNRRPLRPASPGAPEPKALVTSPGRFSGAFKKYEEKRIKEARGAGGFSDDGPVRSKDGIIDMYRKHFAAQGIRDEEYVVIMSLEHADTQWAHAMVAAAKALDDKNYESARELIKNALSGLDERHLIARARLLGMLSNIEYRAADPEAGRAAQRDSDETKIEVAKIFVRAMVEKREGGLTVAQGQQILDSLADQRDEQDNVARVSEIFSGPGEDPEKAPQRIMGMFKVILDAPDGDGKRGG